MKNELDKKGDVSFLTDLTQAITECIEIEKHAEESYNMSKDKNWLDIRDGVRKVRSKWLNQITGDKIQNNQGWCISKHCLGGSKNFHEVSTRLWGLGQKELSAQAESDATFLKGIFLLINNIGGEK